MTATSSATSAVSIGTAVSRDAANRRRAVARAAAGPVLGLLVAAVCAIRMGVPSFWGDEAATVMSAERGWGSLLRELSNVDSVHGLYYAMMHLWIAVFGATETAARFPSIIGAALAVWGVVALGRSLFGSRVGLIAGAVLLVIPEFTRIAIEARSYAIAAALGVWITVLLVRLVGARPGSVRRAGWVLYAAAAATSVVLFEFLGLLVLAHAALLWALRAPRSSVRRWALSLAAATPVVTVVVLMAYRERGQVAFLADRDYGTVFDVLVEQWFRDVAPAILLWSLILVGLALLGRRIRPQRRRAVAIAVWAFLPTAIIVAINVAIVPIYNERYVAFCIPAVAIMVALGVDAVVGLLRRSTRPAIAAIVAVALAAALALAAAPTFIAQRGPYAKDQGADLRQAAALLHRVASPGDAVVFTQDIRASKDPRVEVHLYPKDFVGLDDVELVTPYQRTSWLWDTTRTVDDAASRLASHPVVWADEIHGYARADLDALRAMGYRVTESLHVHRTVLYRLEKEAS